MNDQPRGNMYLLTGLILGLAIGLLVSLVAFPVRYENSNPAQLKPAHKDEYRLLIAEAWRVDGNLPRALQRLGLLRDEDPAVALSTQAQNIRTSGGSPEEAQGLSDLAELAGSQLLVPPVENEAPPAANTPQAQPSEPQPAETPQAEAEENSAESQVAGEDTPPDAEANAAADATAYRITDRAEVCDGSLPAGFVVVEVENAAGEPLAGVKVDVAWDGGSDVFYTGLSPKVSLGYGDFQMKPALSYTVQAGGGEIASDITIPACGGAVRLRYRQ